MITGSERRRTHVVVLPQELQVLVLVLSECLCDLRLLDNIEHRLSLVLELFVGRDSLFALLGKFWRGS